jgi:hypothetical protein
MGYLLCTNNVGTRPHAAPKTPTCLTVRCDLGQPAEILADPISQKQQQYHSAPCTTHTRNLNTTSSFSRLVGSSLKQTGKAERRHTGAALCSYHSSTLSRRKLMRQHAQR